MAGAVSIKLLGDKALERKLKGLVPALQKKIVRKAMREAIRPVAADAKANAPVLSGLTQLSLKVMARKYRDRTKFGVKVSTEGLAGVPIYYASFNELGTSHQPARPFMRPALNSNRATSTEILKREVGAAIEAEARRG